MKQTNSTVAVTAMMAMIFSVFTLTSCAAIGDVFKAGAWTGIILVVLVIALIIFIISRLGGGNKS